MKKNVMGKNLAQSIKRSIGRYIAIVAIIALGSAIFVGLRTSRSDMIATGQKFMDSQNMFDLRLLNTYGWTEDNVEQAAKLDGVASAEGVISMDVLAVDSGTQTESVYKFYAIPETVNKVYLLGGRMPEAPGECLADGAHATDEILGKTYTVTENNDQDTLDSLTCRTYTVVGYVSTPLYMDMSRGNTSVGNGTVTGYLYVPAESFDVDYYTEIDVTLEIDHTVYAEEYHAAMENAAEELETAVQQIANERYHEIVQEAEDAYSEGLAEYEDGLAEYEDGKREAEESLEEARQELTDAEDSVVTGTQDLEDAEDQVELAWYKIDKAGKELEQSKQDLETKKTETYAQLDATEAELKQNYEAVTNGLAQVNDGLAQISASVPDLETNITQLEQGIAELNTPIAQLESGIQELDTAIQTAQASLAQAQAAGMTDTAAQLEATIQQLSGQRGEYNTQYQQLVAARTGYSTQLTQLKEIQTQKQSLEAQKSELEANLAQINDGLTQLTAARAEADTQFADARKQITEAEEALVDARWDAYGGWQEIQDGWQELDDAKAEIADGWLEYEDGKTEAEQELADAEAELSDAWAELQDARQEIDDLEAPEIYILDRTTNVGYQSLDSNSNIVAGVSKVFPAFFLLIAALVCITTMTRMVEEERTQIGTLKALGYGNFSIIFKYLAYACSGALIGCGLGVLVGSVVFPLILWQAYQIILTITPGLVLQLDWGLCITVVLSYTAVTLLVTWYTCRMALREVPAELIRPKPPTSGRKILLEHLPFWDKISFLNKVMLRNIFRYRQRLLMMLVGIGGCTALLVTGFGIRDSIVDIVSYQFQEITTFDMQVMFSDDVTLEDQQSIRDTLGTDTQSIDFFYQSGIEVDFEDSTKEITLIMSDGSIETYFDFHSGDTPLTLPEAGEAMLSVGTAENMGVQVGDTITLRDSDMNMLTVTVSAIFDNNVSNYVIVSPETIEAQWGYVPECQMAYVITADGQDVHALSAKLSEMGNVLNVTVSVDMAEQVSSMLEALDMIVVTVVICAGMLAVTVLYNLTNINITERIREIATIKVLGFNSKESSAYVFKENLLLSGMGAILGLFAGKGLLDFVISQIKVDMVWIQPRVLAQSYLWAILLTMLSALIVDYLLSFKLEKINMAEALKSVE